MTAEHGYTGLSRATDETHIWMGDPPGPTGDCGHLHCRPAVENRIDSLVRQLASSGVRPAATGSDPVTETMTDHQLVDRRDQLFLLFKDGPLNEPTIDFAYPTTRAYFNALEGKEGARAELDLPSGFGAGQPRADRVGRPSAEAEDA